MEKLLVKHIPRKRFGQNFLKNQSVIEKILQALELKATDHVLEIGPGQGALTWSMAEKVKQLDAIEIDRELCEALKLKAASFPHVHIDEQDALQCDLRNYLKETKETLRVVGNLPYNISTPLIFHLLSQDEFIEDMHFMLQKEVVQRMAAPPGSKTYGRLSVMVQYHCEVIPLINVPPSAFYPAPKVDSAVVRLIPRAWQTNPCAPSQLETVVTAAFNQRRKTLRNSLKEYVTPDKMEKAGIDPSLRPEMLSIQDFVTLAHTLDG